MYGKLPVILRPQFLYKKSPNDTNDHAAQVVACICSQSAENSSTPPGLKLDFCKPDYCAETNFK